MSPEQTASETLLTRELEHLEQDAERDIRHNIEPIPQEERHGVPRSQFTLWFSAQLYMASIVLGAVGIVTGLGLWPTIWALVAANFLGEFFNSTDDNGTPAGYWTDANEPSVLWLLRQLPSVISR